MTRVLIRALTLDLARVHAERVAALLSLIPGCAFTSADVLATHKRSVALTGRWEHSQAALMGGRVIGALLTYERPLEPASAATGGLVVYPAASFYLDGISVDAGHRGRGIASALIRAWLNSTDAAGYAHLTGPPAWSLQTNANEENAPVRRLYERFGFAAVGLKDYDNRSDVVMWRGTPTCTPNNGATDAHQ